MKHWTREESKERFPKAISPLGWSLLQVPLEATLNQMSKTFGVKNYHTWDMLLWKDNYVYSRKDFFKSFRHLQFNYQQIFRILKTICTSFFKTLLDWNRKGRFKDRLLVHIFYSLFGTQVRTLVEKWPQERTHLKKIMGRDFHLEDIFQIDYDSFMAIKNQMQEDSRVFFAEDFNVYFLKKLLFGLIKSELVNAGVEEKKAEEMITSLTYGLEGNFSVQMARDFQNQDLGQDELKKRYGHLTDNWDLFAPTLGESEEFWSFRKESHSISPQMGHSEKEIIELLSWNEKIPEMISWFLQLVLIDEDLRAYSSLQYPQARKLMKLVEQSEPFKEMVVQENSIYFLDLIEIEHALKKKNFHPFFDLIKPRREAFLKALKTHPPFELKEHDNGRFEEIKKLEQKTQALEGLCVSPGIVSGEILIINEATDIDRISKKTIIVLASATPVYAPLYAICGGIISEMGGQLSHGAIVAREFGIPMLTGVENACVILKSGQSVVLDADKGTIRVGP